MSNGWIKLHRSVQECCLWDEKPFSKGQAWIDLILSANHKDKKLLIDGEIKTVERGQFVTSILGLADRWGWDRKKVSKFLNILESDNMITQNRTTHGTTLTVVNYGIYQDCGTTDGTTDGQPMVQPMDNHWTADGTTDGQPFPINKNVKKDKNEKNEKNEKNVENDKKERHSEEIKEIIDYLNAVCGTRYSHSSDKSCKHIRARLNEDYTVDDFKTVIDKKAREWIGDPKMSKFLRPETLFGTKFEGYLNQIDSEPRGSTNTFAGVDWSKV